MTGIRKFAALALSASFAASLALVANVAYADDLPTFKLEMADGKLNPARIEVPAGKRIKIEVRNTGKGAAEFESVQLRKEKVLAPGADSFVVIAPLDPGEYKFFDDFHQQAQGVIVAK
ncbi:cupredoxin domain-containing protein [Paraburkholderia silviterrae]|uniref:Cupredoxin domain-containing protein n=1 Tax=Paraburkholderia silviterrae TaxID=2528715 RepID=A0A4R5MDC1_9BURK|nr:cupredoxin domain-containing protein [Paraburkholderia silviterrae]TDG25090.1 cupredoxin domain-containing protein [Paraburkholderia silviterrae]